MSDAPSTRTRRSNRAEAVTLVDLLDRVVDRGVVVSGDLVITLAGVDLIYLNLRLLLCSAERVLHADGGNAG
jgi:gas vesicle structural protein